MGQPNAKRIQYVPLATILNPVNDNIQELNDVSFLELNDTVDVLDVDANGNVLSVLADNLTVLSFNPGTKKVTLSASVDTTAATGTPKLYIQEIDDVQVALDRLFKRKSGKFDLRQSIVEFDEDTPTAGKTTYYVDDASFFRAGDEVAVIDDTGVLSVSATIESVNVNADAANNRSSIVITSDVPVTLLNNPYIQNLTIDLEKAVRRNQERIDEIDRPVKNEDLGEGNGAHTAFEVASLFVQGSSELYMDGNRKKIGTPGTRAGHTEGAGNAQLIFLSMILGLPGNDTEVRVQAGAGFSISVSGNFTNGHTVTINNNGGLATAKEIADALNAHAEAKRLIQVRYGGDGTGVVSAFGPTALAGGLDDGTGDYAELEQIFKNLVTGTGFKWVSFHIRPNEKNRLSSPPDDDEELAIDYAKAADNVDR